ncbi:DUF1302 family protein [Algiphilus sp.]|uniref:DUF1302 family protein n=1 Tax=Algiphilus sp. TaxID=1872431 RepID=UPI0025BC59D9|nr:DUF1302 family protein [Algiphilus sp.]MCK5769681.1 hypothetical protein [Algiphilus sp.]
MRAMARTALAAAILGAAAGAGAQDDMDDLLGGFEDMDDYTGAADAAGQGGFDDRPWDLGGSLSAEGSYNLRDHASTTGTDYDGLSRLRLRGTLGLDVDLGERWRGEVAATGWQDLAYAYRDADYTDAVRDAYEKELEVLDAWIAGELGGATDLKIGRQITVWGFADNLRVLDVLNPLDNLEPGRADIEDLRRPTGMVRLDHYAGPWRATLVVTPEHRFSRNPPFGSDFYPVTDGDGNAVRYREIRPDDFEDPDYAAALLGRFSGWDLSLNVARFWMDEPFLDASAFERSPGASQDDFENAAVLRHSRVTLAGFGVQVTRGGWLFKHEAALVDGVDVTRTTPLEQPLPLINAIPIVGALVPDADGRALPEDTRAVRRYDALLGVEYFGLPDTTFAVEIAGRHLDDFDDDLALSGYRELRGETALRATRDFLNQRLRVILISVLFNDDGRFWEATGGAVHRINAEYDLGGGLEVVGGVLIYEGGDQRPFNVSADNDRLFGEIKWSF